ncbi:hypothetical protein H072_6797 [Dactylellina haptotyla CBS 200.50]|uniref:Uncharacterized protein n=1 Tax=Dactylellina haptotyla (strain CBS 200.50) TaxID=1284197 RepID=S8A8S0_DACHA|nr:hypothetical protein H072_6797 [Dactylellina haptotyla CBS 200.50]
MTSNRSISNQAVLRELARDERFTASHIRNLFHALQETLAKLKAVLRYDPDDISNDNIFTESVLKIIQHVDKITSPGAEYGCEYPSEEVITGIKTLSAASKKLHRWYECLQKTLAFLAEVIRAYRALLLQELVYTRDDPTGAV